MTYSTHSFNNWEYTIWHTCQLCVLLNSNVWIRSLFLRSLYRQYIILTGWNKKWQNKSWAHNVLHFHNGYVMYFKQRHLYIYHQSLIDRSLVNIYAVLTFLNVFFCCCIIKRVISITHLEFTFYGQAMPSTAFVRLYTLLLILNHRLPQHRHWTLLNSVILRRYVSQGKG